MRSHQAHSDNYKLNGPSGNANYDVRVALVGECHCTAVKIAYSPSIIMIHKRYRHSVYFSIQMDNILYTFGMVYMSCIISIYIIPFYSFK